MDQIPMISTMLRVTTDRENQKNRKNNAQVIDTEWNCIASKISTVRSYATILLWRGSLNIDLHWQDIVNIVKSLNLSFDKQQQQKKENQRSFLSQRIDFV